MCIHKYDFEAVRNFLGVYVRRWCGKCQTMWKWNESSKTWVKLDGKHTNLSITPRIV